MPRSPIHLRGTILPGGERRDIWVRDGRLTFLPVDGARTVFLDGWLLPGLVDMHAHLALASPDEAAQSVGAAVRASERAHLDAGVLTIRDPGGPTDPERAAGGLADPPDDRPRVQAAGRFLAPPGGYFPGLARFVEPGTLAAAALEEARSSGGWAKVIGDFLGPGGAVVPNWDAAELAAAARAVHEAGGRIAVHAMVAASIEAAIDAGVDSIEHATELRAEHLPELVRRRIALVPTLLIAAPVVEVIAGFGAGAAVVEHWARVVARQPAVVAAAAEAGVLVLAGTDAGMVPHGLVGSEIDALRRAGVDPHQAVGAGSWLGRDFLGLPGIEEGAPADLVAFERDPRGEAGMGRPLVRILDGTVLDA